ncbi:MAG: type II secretion system protein [Waddliaceae bacterium]
MVESSKRPFTLIEIILVLALISLMLGIVGINIRNAFVKQNFLTEVEAIASNMRLAQDLTLVQNEDVSLYFEKSKENNQFNHWIEVDCEEDKRLQRVINQSKVQLKSIREISFRDEHFQSEENETERIVIRFFSGGYLMSRGVLTLVSAHSQTQKIPLFGYPHAIHVHSSYPDLLPDSNSINDQLTELMIDEIANAN